MAREVVWSGSREVPLCPQTYPDFSGVVERGTYSFDWKFRGEARRGQHTCMLDPKRNTNGHSKSPDMPEDTIQSRRVILEFPCSG